MLQLIGRILFGMIFFMFGVTAHFMNTGMMAEMAAGKGVPAAGLMVILTGAMILLGGLSVILGYKPKIGLWLLVAFLVPVALIMHNFWALEGAEQMAQMSNFFKNMSLAGAALMLLQTDVDSWPYTVGGSNGGGSLGGPAGGSTAAGSTTGGPTSSGPSGGPGSPAA